VRHFLRWGLMLAVAVGSAVSPDSPAHGRGRTVFPVPARRPTPALSTIPDSVALRLFSKSWVGEGDVCDTWNWGWDSLTWRLAPRNTLVDDLLDRLGVRFRLGRILARDSAWLIYSRRRLEWLPQPGEPYPRVLLPNELPEWDSVVVTTRPVKFGSAIGIVDTAMWFRAELVSPWPQARQAPRKTTTLRGRVVDHSTGRGIAGCQVVVDDTKCSAYTDPLGLFVLRGVPVGVIGVLACSRGWSWEHVEVRVPVDSLVIRVDQLVETRSH
jgi:hypothetical protein